MDFSSLNATKEKIKGNAFGNAAYKKAKSTGFSMGLNSFLGTAGATVYGVALAYSSEINKFFGDRFGFTLFEEAERCKINDIALEWVQIKSDERSSNVSHGNRKYSISVILSDLVTKNAESIYEQIVELWQKKTLCTISTVETIEDMIITKVSRSYKTQSALEFEIDFEVLEFAYLMRKGDILGTELTTLREEQKTGIAGTKTSNIEYKGFLK